MQSQTKDELFIILEQNHQILKNENIKAAPGKTIKQQPHKKDPYPLIEKENLTEIINLSGPPTTDLKYTVNQLFNPFMTHLTQFPYQK